NGPPASLQWPMSPLVTDTNLTWWPCVAHRMATPAALSSQSSGCAPKQRIRSFPSSGGTAWRFATDCSALGDEPVVAGDNTPNATTLLTAPTNVLHLIDLSCCCGA